MNGKVSKKLKLLSKILGDGKSPEEQKLIYKQLKKVHKLNKGKK